MTRVFDIEAVRAEFPALHQEVANGKALVYLDNAATTQKPQAVLDCIDAYYCRDNSNVHRGAHTLADRATRQFEGARARVAQFVNAQENEIVWTRGTTEAINLVANTWGRANLKAGDRVVISCLEHHSNIVPWQIVCAATGAELVVAPILDNGELDMQAFAALLDERVRLVSITHVSNALGTVNPAGEIVRLAHAAGALVMFDGAQAVGHFPIDVQALDCDFYAVSGHKLFGPTGIGFLYGRYTLLEKMPPWQGGGEMIERVSFSGTTYQAPPLRFEAGTPNIAGVIAMAAGIDYYSQFDRAQLHVYEQELLAYATWRAKDFDGLIQVGTAANKAGVLSFNLAGGHAHDVGTLLDQQGVAVRTGHHCAQPLMQRLNISGTVRASFSFYNNRADVDQLFSALTFAKSFL